MEFYSISVLAFLGIVALIIYRDKKNIEFQYGILMRRTKVGIKILDKLARPTAFWKFLGTVGIIICLFLMFDGVASLVRYGKLLATGAVTAPGLSFVLPSINSQVEVGRGYILMPFWFWLIIIISVIFPHEGFHGILSRVEKIRVKTAGILLLLILPGAFVEPDEKQLKKARLISKLRVFTAGSLANFLVYFIAFNFISFVLWPCFVPGPIVISEVNATGPASVAGLKAGMVVTEINGKTVKATYDEFLNGSSYLVDETKGLKPGDEIFLVANGTFYNVKLAVNPENKTIPYLGIMYGPVINSDSTTITFIFQLLTWVWIINYAISVFNIMPIYPLDGGLVVQAIVEKINKKYANKMTYAITFIVLLILAYNFIMPFL